MTDEDLRNQVIETLSGEESDFNVSGIVAEFIDRYGVVSVDTIDGEQYWSVVNENACD